MSEQRTTRWQPAHGGPISVQVPVTDASRVGEARRAADTVARAAGLDEHSRGKLGIVVTEAATNLARHAREGVVLLRALTNAPRIGVEMLAVDRGPGMDDLSRFFVDGYSTGGTAGGGLGAMRRQADELDIYSRPGSGTVAVARVFAADRKGPALLLDVGVVCVPLDGETACGDAWCVRQDAERACVLLVDGLGHGAHAAEAADAAVAVFEAAGDHTPRELVAQLHQALRSTRGAALAVAEVRRAADGTTSVNHCGVGNTVSALVGSSGSRALPSMNGTAGLTIARLNELSLPWDQGSLLVMHTDGIATRWSLDQYPRIREHDPAVAAGVLHRDFTRRRDDATVLALRLRSAT